MQFSKMPHAAIVPVHKQAESEDISVVPQDGLGILAGAVDGVCRVAPLAGATSLRVGHTKGDCDADGHHEHARQHKEDDGDVPHRRGQLLEHCDGCHVT